MHKSLDTQMKISGFTIIESLITLILSGIILNLLVDVYLAHLHNHQVEETILYLQANAEKVINSLAADIPKAGHIGCARLSENVFVTDGASHILDVNNKLESKNHILIIRYMSTSFNVLLKASQATDNLRSSIHNKSLFTNRQITVAPHDKLIISDCRKAELMKVKAVRNLYNGQMIFLESPLANIFYPLAEVGHLMIRKYFIQNTKRHRQDGSVISALFRQDLNDQKVEIAENISEFKLLFSIKNKDQDLPATAIKDWSQVIGIIIEFKVIKNEIQKTFNSYIKIN